MKTLRKKRSQKVFGITVGASTVFIPSDYNPEETLGTFIYEQLSSGVPISNVRFSLASYLSLTERVYQKLIEIGQPEIARQILPKGGCNGDI